MSYSPDDYVRYRLNRAYEMIEDVKILIERKRWNTAGNRLYYACFYAVGALLIKNDVVTSTHGGVRRKFGELFVHTGLISKDMAKLYTELFDNRQQGDYSDFYDLDEDTVSRFLQPSIDFIAEIEKLINPPVTAS